MGMWRRRRVVPFSCRSMQNHISTFAWFQGSFAVRHMARPSASSTTYAFVCIDHHDAIPFTLVHRRCRAVFHTHWVGAVVAGNG